MQEPVVRFDRDIAYIDPSSIDFDPKAHVLDVYRPLTPEPDEGFDVVVVVHGGAWLFGSKNSENAMEVSKCLARHGKVAVTISYRLSPLDRDLLAPAVFGLLASFGVGAVFAKQRLNRLLWCLLFLVLLLTFISMELYPNATSQRMRPPSNLHPAHVRDVASAVNWTKDHIREYTGNPNRVFLLGHSAGGHLVSMAACDPTWLGEHNMRPASDLKGVICISGVYSALQMHDHLGGDAIAKCAFGKDRSLWPGQFPMVHAATSDDLPPLLLLNAEYEWGLKVHGIDFRNVLERRGADVDAHIYQVLNHYTIFTDWEGRNHKLMEQIQLFISRH